MIADTQMWQIFLVEIICRTSTRHCKSSFLLALLHLHSTTIVRCNDGHRQGKDILKRIRAYHWLLYDLERKKTARADFQIDILVLARKSSSIAAKIIRFMSTLHICNSILQLWRRDQSQCTDYLFKIKKLPKQVLKADIMKAELFYRYVDEFLSPLFDDPDEGVLFRW